MELVAFQIMKIWVANSMVEAPFEAFLAKKVIFTCKNIDCVVWKRVCSNLLNSLIYMVLVGYRLMKIFTSSDLSTLWWFHHWDQRKCSYGIIIIFIMKHTVMITETHWFLWLSLCWITPSLTSLSLSFPLKGSLSSLTFFVVFLPYRGWGGRSGFTRWVVRPWGAVYCHLWRSV